MKFALLGIIMNPSDLFGPAETEVVFRQLFVWLDQHVRGLFEIEQEHMHSDGQRCLFLTVKDESSFCAVKSAALRFYAETPLMTITIVSQVYGQFAGQVDVTADDSIGDLGVFDLESIIDEYEENGLSD